MAALPIGLNIGRRIIKAVRLQRDRSGVSVRRFAQVPTPPKASSSGGERRLEGLGQALRQLWASSRLGSRRIALGVSTVTTMVRVTRFPTMTERELRRALRWEAEKHIPLASQDSIIDFAVPPDQTAGGQMQVLLAGTPRQQVLELLEQLRVARLSAVTLDIEPLAAYRALFASGLYRTQDDAAALVDDDSAVVLLDIGGSDSRVTLFNRGLPVLDRSVGVGGSSITKVVSAGLEIPLDKAEQLKMKYGLSEQSPIHSLVIEATGSLFREVLQSVELYCRSRSSLVVRRIYLTGGLANMGGLAPALEEWLEENRPDVGMWRSQTSQRVRVPELVEAARVTDPQQEAEEFGAQYVTAVGLALWGASM